MPASHFSRRTMRRSIGLGAALAIVAVLGVKLVICSSSRVDCTRAIQSAPFSVAVAICQREYERTHNETTAAMLAEVLLEKGNYLAAATLAYSLRSTEVRSDAARILAKIALSEGWLADAASALEYAKGLHRRQHRVDEIAKDERYLAEIHSKRLQFSEALLALDACIAEARSTNNTVLEGDCHLAAAQVLTRVGYLDAARQEIDRAAQFLTSASDLARLWYERGNIESSPTFQGKKAQMAVAEFEQALAYATHAQRYELIQTLELNLAYSLAEIGRVDDAEQHLADAASLDRDNVFENERGVLAARIAYRRGNLDLAWSLNERVYPRMDAEYDREAMIDLSVIQTRIALARHDLSAAEHWARIGVDHGEKLRSIQTSLELRSWIMSRQREPYELLFTILVHANRPEEALLVFDSWQGRTLIEAMARPGQLASPDLRGVAGGLASLGRWFPSISEARVFEGNLRNDRAAIDVLRGIDLLALIVADQEVWCVTARRGQLRISNLGPLSKLRERFDRFFAQPTDQVLASELGALILRDGIFRPTDDALRVLLDASFVALPIAALRRDGQPLIAVRPVLRVPKLPTERCAHVERPTHALVLADAAGDLPDARREALIVGHLLDTTSDIGPAATSEALFGASRDMALHLAVHAEIDAGGGVLKLHDRGVSAAEISARRLGPSLVVLAACSTARSWNPQFGSLATAFLSAGSTDVVATLRPVSDAGTNKIVTRFYEAGGVKDPVRALAMVQARLSATDDQEWPSFAVYGGEFCSSHQ